MTTVEWKMQIYAPTAFPHFWDFSGIFLGFFWDFSGILWDSIGIFMECGPGWPKSGIFMGFLWDFFWIFMGIKWETYGMWTWMTQKWDFFLWDFYGINMGLL